MLGFAPQPTRARQVFIKQFASTELKFCNDFTKENIVSCFDWLSAIVKHKKISLDELNSRISFYGNENSTYMVVERFITDMSADQFVIDAHEEGLSLKVILSLLAQVDYNAKKLLTWLDSLDYAQNDVGDVYRNADLTVVRKIISRK